MKICIMCGEKFDRTGWECPSCNAIPDFILGFPAFSPNLAETSESFKISYFEQLANIEAYNFWFRSRNRLIIWALQQYFPNAKNFFEIGCGTGFVLSGIESMCPQLLLFGSDIYSNGLTITAKRTKKTELFQMDACQIPFENEFDVVGAFDVLEHIEEDELALSQMYQAICRGGGIILTVPQHPFLWSYSDEYACHVRRYNARELKTKVRLAGFETVKMTSFVSLLFPLMVISRLKKRQPNVQYDIMAELKLGSLTNTFLEKMLDLERGLINLGIHLPFGGSLLLIARKV